MLDSLSSSAIDLFKRILMKRAEKAQLKELESNMPELFKEMRQDLKKTPLKREFILSPTETTMGWFPDGILVYYENKHSSLQDKVNLLIDHGMVIDITTTKYTPKYRMQKDFVQYLINA